MLGRNAVRVQSNTRGGFFKEFGSPHTGGPVPWITEPAERAAEKLAEELAKAGDPW